METNLAKFDKELLEKTIADVEKSIETSRDNLRNARQHIAEGEAILEIFRQKLSELQ